MDCVTCADLASTAACAGSRFFSSLVFIFLQEFQQLVLLDQHGDLPLKREALVGGVPVILVEIPEFVPIAFL